MVPVWPLGGFLVGLSFFGLGEVLESVQAAAPVRFYDGAQGAQGGGVGAVETAATGAPLDHETGGLQHREVLADRRPRHLELCGDVTGREFTVPDDCRIRSRWGAAITRNDLRWTGGITASRPARPGPLVRGATVERTARFLGRSFTYGFVVTAHEPDHLVELKVDRPFPMLVRYELADADEGTLVAIHATGTPGRFFGWATPFMTRQVGKNITADLERLRACLEQ